MVVRAAPFPNSIEPVARHPSVVLTRVVGAQGFDGSVPGSEALHQPLPPCPTLICTHGRFSLRPALCSPGCFSATSRRVCHVRRTVQRWCCGSVGRMRVGCCFCATSYGAAAAASAVSTAAATTTATGTRSTPGSCIDRLSGRRHY